MITAILTALIVTVILLWRKLHKVSGKVNDLNRTIAAVSNRLSERFAQEVNAEASKLLAECQADILKLKNTAAELRLLHELHEQHSVALAANLQHTQEKYLGLGNHPDVFKSSLLAKEN
jgi:hypothetical protein